MKQAEIVCCIGITAFVGGTLIFLYGLFGGPEASNEVLTYFSWALRATVCFYGGLLAVIGSAVASFGFFQLRKAISRVCSILLLPHRYRDVGSVAPLGGGVWSPVAV